MLRKRVKQLLAVSLAGVMLMTTACGEAETTVAEQESTEAETDGASEDAAVSENSAEGTLEQVINDSFAEELAKLTSENWEGGYISQIYISTTDEGFNIDASIIDDEGTTDTVNFDISVETIIEKVREQSPEEADRLAEIVETLSEKLELNPEEMQLNLEQIADYLGYRVVYQDAKGIALTKAFQTKRLIVSNVTEEIKAEDYGATAAVSSGDGIVVLQFATIDETAEAYDKLVEKYGAENVAEDVVMGVNMRDWNIYEGVDIKEQQEQYYEFSQGNNSPFYDALITMSDSEIYSAYPAIKEWSESPYLSWGVTSTGADKFVNAMSSADKNNEVIVAVVDTGYNSSNKGIYPGRVLEEINILDSGKTGYDSIGHGTHVTGTILDMTDGTSIKVLPIAIADEEGRMSNASIAAGVSTAVKSGAKVINMSLGGYVFDNSASSVDVVEIKKAIASGVTVVCSAGNETRNTKYASPANIPECICVAACEPDNQRVYFSNYGEEVDITAPGYYIMSTVPADYESFSREYQGEYIADMSGTSMAAPHVSAAAALLIAANVASTPAEVENTIMYCAEDAGTPGIDQYYGAGILDLTKVLNGDGESVSDDGERNGNTGERITEPYIDADFAKLEDGRRVIIFECSEPVTSEYKVYMDDYDVSDAVYDASSTGGSYLYLIGYIVDAGSSYDIKITKGSFVYEETVYVR